MTTGWPETMQKDIVPPPQKEQVWHKTGHLLGRFAKQFGLHPKNTPHVGATIHTPMKTIQVYDPPMCCSTGICGTNVDPDLVNFAAILSQLAGQGVRVERQNLGQQPMAFAQNPVVKEALQKEGTSVLPLIFLDGEIYMKGRYPSHDERPGFFRAALGIKEAAA